MIVLFLCTGNYYRSRYAEILFNHLAAGAGLPWRAASRGLACGKGCNVGPMSIHTQLALQRRQIPLPMPLRLPLQLTEADLSSARRVIALKEAEHRALLAENFPEWEERVAYWHVHDRDVMDPALAVLEIDAHVEAMVRELRDEQNRRPR